MLKKMIMISGCIIGALCVAVVHTSKQPVCTKQAATEQQSKTVDATKNGSKEQSTKEKQNKNTQQKRTITLSNDIDPDALGYKYIITYYPTLFEIRVNDTLIAPGKKETIPVINDQITIKYYCEFKDGARKSCKEYIFTVFPNQDSLHLTFDWHSDPRIIVDHGTMIQCTHIEL